MHFAQLTTTTDTGTPRCNACQWRCVLPPGEQGRCLVRTGSKEGVVVHNYGLISAATVGHVEDYLLWHFFPDSLVLTVGGWGYAFPTDQQRGGYAHIPQEEKQRRYLPPERIAAVALKQLCRGVIWAYSEPAVSQDYVLDVLKSSRASSRYTALVTTGYMTQETLDSFGLYLDGVSLDLRGFGDRAYARLGGIDEWRAILDIVARARYHWHCHIEVTSRLHYGVNDDPDELRAMVEWIREVLGDQIPWHIQPGDAGAATAAAVVRARRIGHEGGLKFVYGPEPNQTTRCPSCQAAVITRQNRITRLVGITDNACSTCGYPIYLSTSIFKRV